MKKIRSYSELSRLETFQQRFDYLRLVGSVGVSTFGFDRYLNQTLYKSPRWKSVRDLIILRDNGCDLGVPGYEILHQITVHHINPITPEEIINGADMIFDPNFLVCVSHKTHMAIHYGDEDFTYLLPADRRPGDTKPW